MKPSPNEEFFRGRRVLVAGGTGMIGIPTVQRLCALGAQVKVVAMDSPEFARIVLPEEVEYERVDLTSEANCLAAVEGSDYVLNLVGIKGSVGIGQSKVASYLVPMLRFQTNLMEAAFLHRVRRFLFVSSICTYPQSSAAKREESMWDGAPLQNDRIPGLAKRIGETLAEAYLLEHGWDAPRIVRPANVYGPFDDFNPATGQVIPSLIAKMSGGADRVQIWGDGSAKRDFVFSQDVADWLLIMLEKAPPCVPLNIGSGEAVSISHLANTVASLLPNPPLIDWDSTKPAGDPVRLLSIARAEATVGYQPFTSLRDGLARTLAWYRANPSFRRF